MESFIERNNSKFKFYYDYDENGYNEFLKLWNHSKDKILKLETQPFYQDDREMFESFIHSQSDDFVNYIVSYWNQERSKLHKNIVNNKISLYRLHIIKKPITDYLKSEYYSYIASSFLGEKVKVIDYKKIDNFSLKYMDFMVFDEAGLMITLYNSQYCALGDYFCYDKEIIQYFKNIFLKLFNQSEDFHNMYCGSKMLENRIIECLKEKRGDESESTNH